MKQKLNLALTLAVIFSLLMTSLALADNLITDGDGLTPVNDTGALNLGNVCTGSTITKPILHAISRNGNYPSPNVFANGATVVVSISQVVGSGLSASGGGSISLPSNWGSLPNNTLSNSVSSAVTFVAGAPGAFSGTVKYSAVGAGSSSGTLAREDTLTVTANVVNCDTTPPILHLPADLVVEATGHDGAMVTFVVTADDADPEHPVVDCTPASGSTFSIGDTTVNCSATDTAGNTANGSFTVTVQDTTPPVVTPPSNITVEAVGPAGATVTYSGEAAFDLVDGNLTATCSPVSGAVFPLGITTVTCSATDSRGNLGSSTFNIHVQDTTAPTLILPANVVEEATGPDGAIATFTASASDLVDGDVPVTCSPTSGDTFPLGETTVTCSAHDSNNNTASGSFTVTVVDTTPPTLSLPASITEEAAGPDGAVATFATSASDLVDGDVVVSCAPVSGSLFPLGETIVNCSATDAAGNIANGSFTVTVVDTTPPTLSLPADQRLEATGPDGAVATFSATATDLVSGELEVTCNPGSGQTFPLGTTTVDCQAEDDAGNKASGSFIIVVEDTTPPSITFVTRTPANASGWNNSDVTVEWSCTDIVGVISPTVSAVVSDEGANQSATGTCTDLFGWTASDTQSGINIDKTVPTIIWNGGPANGASYYFGFVPAAPTCTAADDLSGPAGCTVAGYSTNVGQHTLTATAYDNASNSKIETRAYTVAAWTLLGFYQPVDMNGVYNVVKNGSTVPLKFEIFAGPTELTDVAYVKSLTYVQTACNSSAMTDEIETLATGGTVLRYDTTSGQFIFNWKTPSTASKCYRVTMTTIDGSSLVAYFKLK